ncbi:LPS chain length-determining protein [Marinomonas sp. CT5]|uniref:Wzz/FepE/Etk N-terminal domain-containing protein n=1 Tax=Marinomonas sp. CT5 TaxID=2066133 RepID=UPI001BAE7477|nr:Wzz/FepE/Etk N-terminal domain-containing protein [Marinomonas sp. CT5]QUX94470.1 LPS chain length-determining protein [Marinomonas sp. CT5]
MTKGQLSQEKTDPAAVLARNQYDHRDDEIDLKELLIALWQGKFIIIAVTVFCTAVAIIYSLKAKDVWTTEAIITEPQISDFANYQKMVNDFQPIFDVYQGGTILISQQLNSFVSSKYLFQIYLQQYSARSNKKDFISSFGDFKAELERIRETANDNEYRAAESSLYDGWYNRLPQPSGKSGNSSLKSIAGDAEKSFAFLNGYIKYIENQARSVIIANLNSVIESKHNELIQQKNILMDQAKSRLKDERELARYALQIAKVAGVDKPQQNLGDQEIFAINIGSNALEAKVRVLDSLSVDQLSLIEPRLQVINSKLNLLNTLKVNPNVVFNTFQYVEEPEIPLSRTSPKRRLIAILGLLLGGVLGCFIVLVRFAFRDK